MALEDPVDPSIRDIVAVIALQIPDNPDRTEMVLALNMADILGDFERRFVWVVMWN